MEVEPLDTAGIEAAERILIAAERLFGERGFDGVSTRQIAAAAGVSKANIFHHFSSKLALYEAVLARSAERFGELLRQLTASDHELPELLSGFGRRHLQNMLDNPYTVSLFLRQLLDGESDAARRLAGDVVQQGFDLLVETFAALKSRKRLSDTTDPALLALTLIGSNLAFFLLRGMFDRIKAPADAEHFSRQLVGQLIDGVAPPAVAADHKKE